MATQGVAGAITPLGEVTEFLIEADNPGGQINPFGSVVAVADFSVSAPDLSGTITPTGEMTTVPDQDCFPATYACAVEPVTEYTNCVDVCQEPPTEVLPLITLVGTIIPVGIVASVASNCNPQDVAAFDGTQTEQGAFTPFSWFKQDGFSPITFQSNQLACVDIFAPTHTIGVFTGHIGDSAPVLPDDYEVSVILQASSLAGNNAAGVSARVPLNTAFNSARGYYFLYKTSPPTFGIYKKGNVGMFPIPAPLASVSATGYEDSLMRLGFRVQGSTLTGVVNGIDVVQTTDTDYAAGGRVGVYVGWQHSTPAYLKGPFIVRSLSPSTGLIFDRLVDTNGQPLEGHIYDSTGYSITWGDVGTLEQVTFSTIALVNATDVIRTRTFTGLTPGLVARVRLTMTLNRGSVGSGMLFGTKIVGGTSSYFTDALGVVVASPLNANLTITVPLSGIIVVQYGGFGNGTPIPAGTEWDSGLYTWAFSVDDIELFDNCED